MHKRGKFDWCNFCLCKRYRCINSLLFLNDPCFPFQLKLDFCFYCSSFLSLQVLNFTSTLHNLILVLFFNYG